MIRLFSTNARMPDDSTRSGSLDCRSALLVGESAEVLAVSTAEGKSDALPTVELAVALETAVVELKPNIVVVVELKPTVDAVELTFIVPVAAVLLLLMLVVVLKRVVAVEFAVVPATVEPATVEPVTVEPAAVEPVLVVPICCRKK